MNPRLRRALRVLALAAVALTALVGLLLSQGSRLLRDEIERRLGEALVPAASVGSVDLRLLPLPAVELRDLRLTSDDGRTLLAVRSVELVATGLERIERVRVSGLEADLRRSPDGAWNAAGWLRPQPQDAAPTPWPAIARIELEDARIRIADAASGASGELHVARLGLGPLAERAEGRLAVEGAFALDAPTAMQATLEGELAFRLQAGGLDVSALRLDFAAEAAAGEGAAPVRGKGRADAVSLSYAAGSLAAKGLALRIDGEAGGASLQASAALAALGRAGDGWHGEGLTLEAKALHQARTLDFALDAAAALLRGGEWSLPQFAVRLATGGSAPLLSARFGGEVHGEGSSFDARLADGRLQLPHPSADGSTLAVVLEGTLRHAAGELGGTVAGSFDRSRFDGRWDWRAERRPPLALYLQLDRLELDPYLPPPSPDDPPPDLAGWRHWPVSAQLTVGDFRYAGLRASKARLRLAGSPPAAGEGAADTD